ncbi:MAG: DUF1501 domain-containing protein [Solirubrobacterales bacterium]
MSDIPARPHRCCGEHTRAELLRRSVAEAGRGLPAIEPGMPAPAGTGLSRRSFLLRSGGLALSVYGASLLKPGAFSEGVARAATTDGRVLLSVFLDGGVDSLSLLAPVLDPRYQELRPTLKLEPGAGPTWSEDARLQWHPSAAPLHQLHGEGKVTVFPSIGYAGADQSHFTSRHYWEVGETSVRANTGWLGRMLDVVGSPDNPLQGLSLDGYLSPALATARNPVAATWETSYDLWAPGVWGDVEELMHQAFAEIGAKAERSKDAQMRHAGAVARQAGTLRSQLASFPDEIQSPVPYPDESHFSSSLAGLASMLSAGLPIKVASIDAPGGYDTHDEQQEDFDRYVKETCDGLFAFQRDIEARGLADRVVTLVWSEFGRRPEENGSAGTDHGAGGNAFLIGKPVRGQMVGEWPGLDQLDEDENLRATSDFRAVYCSLLEGWFGVDAGAVIPGASSFARQALLR